MCSFLFLCVFFFLLVYVGRCGIVLVCLTDRPPVKTRLEARSGPLRPPAMCWRSSTGCSLCPQSELECRSRLSQERQGQVSLKWEPSMEEKKKEMLLQGYHKHLKKSNFICCPSNKWQKNPTLSPEQLLVGHGSPLIQIVPSKEVLTFWPAAF